MKNKNEQSELKIIHIKPFTKKELANLYQISPYVFRTWLNEHPELQRQKGQRVFSIKEVEKIFEVFGTPDSVMRKIAA